MGFHCGADVSLLSQFGNEREVLFPPLTMLRAIRRDDIGSVDTIDENEEQPASSPRASQTAAHFANTWQRWHNLDRAHFLAAVPGEKSKRERARCLWGGLAEVLLHARWVTQRSKEMHLVTEEVTPEGHPYVRVCAQPNFTGIDVTALEEGAEQISKDVFGSGTESQ